MKFFRCILTGMLVFLCLFGSCSTGGTDPKDLLAEEEKSQKEEKKPSDEEKQSGEKNSHETQDETQEETQEEETQDEREEILPAPVFVLCKTLPENEIVFEFSGPVSFTSVNFDPELKYEVIGEGSEIKIKLVENPDPGLSVEADLQVKDEYGNILTEQISFRTRNNRFPLLQINELRTENDNPKAEFIEFKMLSDGNLGALRVFAAGNDKKAKIFEFAPVAVKKGDYVVLHLRTYGNLCKDEYGENLELSGGTDSCPTARDFWIPGSTELLRKSDAVYVLDQDDEVLDAVMFAVNSDAWLNKNYFAEAAELLFDQGAWKSPTGTVCSVTEVVNSSTTTATQTICRDETVENTHTAADWYITAKSCATPGVQNNTKRL